MNDCHVIQKISNWNVAELSQKYGNAYLILCQAFNLPSDVIKAIKDNHEDNGVRLGDVLHHICHNNPNLTREQVIETLKLKQPVCDSPKGSLYSPCEQCTSAASSYSNSEQLLSPLHTIYVKPFNYKSC